MNGLYPIIRRKRRPLVTVAPVSEPERIVPAETIELAQAQAAVLADANQEKPIEPKPEPKRARSR